MTNEAKYLPAASLMTVTLDGAAGSSRDHRTSISPIFARYTVPPGRSVKALVVNRAD
jgi:hypothetical protein